MSHYYIYQITEDCGTPRYIGKGSGTRRNRHFRIVANIRGSARDRKYMHRQMAEAITEGRKFTVTNLADQLSEADAYIMEEQLIAQIGRKIIGTGPLWNILPGSGFGSVSLPFDVRSEMSRKANATRGSEGRSALSRKTAQTLGPEGCSARTRKANVTRGPEACRAATRKAKATLGPEGIRAAARKAIVSMGSEKLSARGHKRAQTLGPDRLREWARKVKETLGSEGISAAGRKGWAALSLEERAARRRGLSMLTPEELSIRNRQGWVTRRALKLLP